MRKIATTVVLTAVIVLMIALVAMFSLTSLAQGPLEGVDKLMFHHSRQRAGWNDRETVLTPQSVSSAAFGLLWESAPLDEFDGRPPRLFASPLYVHAIKMSVGPLAGRTVSALYAVTSAGYAYAINAVEVGDTKPGEVLWRQHLTDQPCDGLGNLSTPIIDLSRNRIYLSMCTGDTWRAYALDIRSGEPLPGWPVVVDAAAIDAAGVHRNGNRRRWGADTQPAPGSQGRWQLHRLQRGALALNADSSRLYLTFGEPGGWIVSIDTGKRHKRIFVDRRRRRACDGWHLGLRRAVHR
jgi:hypothetical protein